MVVGKHLRRVVRAVGFDLLFPFHPGTEALMTNAAQAAYLAHPDSGCIPVSLVSSRPAAFCMLTRAEREQTLRHRARAAAELLSIQDGLLGRGWRVREREAYLKGFLNGISLRLRADEAQRN